MPLSGCPLMPMSMRGDPQRRDAGPVGSIASKIWDQPESGVAMLFYVFLLVVAVGLVVLLIRSPVVRQLRRGHGNDRPHGDARDHAFKNTEYQREIDPTARPRPRAWE